MPHGAPSRLTEKSSRPLAHEAQHLVAAVLRLDPLGVLGEVPLQALLVGRQAEEPVALGEPLQVDRGMVGAVRAAGILDQLRGRDEALVGAVPALVRAHVEVAVGIGAAQHLVHRDLVVGIRGPDEAVRRDGQGVLRARKSTTISSTNALGVMPRSVAVWAMLTEYSSVPVRKNVSSPRMRCQRAIVSAPTTSKSVWRPGRLLAYAMAVVR